MITHQPGEVDFQKAGIILLNLAWDQITTDLDHSQHLDDPEEQASYWEAAKPRVNVAFVLCQQGAEFLLKGKISAVDPLLLLSDLKLKNQTTCPEHKKFSAFKTINAESLIRVLEGVIKESLPETFTRKFGQWREKRNLVMHSIDENLKSSPKEVLVWILEITEALIGPRKWPSLRREYLENREGEFSGSCCMVGTQIFQEFSVVVEILANQEGLRFLGVGSDGERYICPECHTHSDDDLLNLTEFNGDTILYCAICDASFPVVRIACTSKSCDGNVLSLDASRCLKCDADQIKV